VKARKLVGSEKNGLLSEEVEEERKKAKQGMQRQRLTTFHG